MVIINGTGLFTIDFVDKDTIAVSLGRRRGDIKNENSTVVGVIVTLWLLLLLLLIRA